MHILNTRRKGKGLPIGIPLSIKEEFLKEATTTTEPRPFTRSTSGNIRDLGASANKDAKDLQQELDALAIDLRTAQKEKELAEERAAELQISKEEFQGLANYKRRQLAALRDEVAQLRDKLKGMGDVVSPKAGAFGGEDGPQELLGKLRAERRMLESRREEVQRSIDATVAELEKV
ncbi:hypothetical protein HK097_005210 [Rhizophlyctis rosea]|uniref:Uncharacterized protein n=1 Tax=Rhizophlyctis rosea TaxID=64517 RepID=A0AAD5S2A9_9FUNG|nr:hypothetical protein HK097_005210 [Rhizophlyctis rosea]